MEGSNEPFLRRNAWKALLVVAAIFALFGLGDVVLGMNADPAIAESISGREWDEVKSDEPGLARLVNLMVRAQGSSIAFLSFLSLAIILGPFRRGERWAWYVLWLWPLWNAGIFLNFATADRSPDFSNPPPLLSAPLFFTVTSLALLASFRNFFPARPHGG